ncbi:MAG TPA: hypothetical protein RMH99_15180, partial [Sandaracinaceae bacterium LLY-WYZ-13_1]|nr:hypothetical protein [Sandaracinaceae bacterium LLY-WYZ-13_1]
MLRARAAVVGALLLASGCGGAEAPPPRRAVDEVARPAPPAGPVVRCVARWEGVDARPVFGRDADDARARAEALARLHAARALFTSRLVALVLPQEASTAVPPAPGPPDAQVSGCAPVEAPSGAAVAVHAGPGGEWSGRARAP